MKPLKIVLHDDLPADFSELLAAGHDLLDEAMLYVRWIAEGKDKRLIGDHALTGKLAGYRACEVGEQDGETGPRLVYQVVGRKLRVQAIGLHDPAYVKAQARR